MRGSITALLLIGVVRSGVQACGPGMFPCKNGDCTRRENVCDGVYDCSDRSDEEFCDPVNGLQYHCADGSGKYPFAFHCNGKVDCGDGSDETNCWRKSSSSMTGHRRCFHGACVEDTDSCCATREGICASPQPDVQSPLARKTLVYANGRDLFSLDLANNRNRRLHRQENSDVSALTHSVAENMIFWIAGQSIWNMTLTAEEGGGRIYGEIEASSRVLTMVYDWTTAKFYLALENPELLVCSRIAGTINMLCSSPIEVTSRQILWLALQPNAGRLYMGSFTSKGIKISVADYNEGDSTPIYENQREAISNLQMSLDMNDIYILRTDGDGSLSVVNALDGTQRQITRNITEAQTVPLVLYNDLAIVRRHRTVQALIFWYDKTVVTRQKLDVPWTSRLFTVIDKEAQQRSDNRCDQRVRTKLCMFVPCGDVCQCDAPPDLMQEASGTFESREGGNERNDEQTALGRIMTLFTNNERTTLNRSMVFGLIIGTVLGAIGCLVTFGSCLLIRQKLFRAGASEESCVSESCHRKLTENSRVINRVLIRYSAENSRMDNTLQQFPKACS